MEVHVTLRYWLLGALCVIVVSGLAWFPFRYQELSGQPCLECAGFRGFPDEWGTFVFCARCGGSGTRAAAAELADELFSMILDARRELLWRVSNEPAETAVVTLLLGMLVGLGFLVRVTGCRVCRGTGRRMRRSCVACLGRGRSTLVDQLAGRR